MSIVAICFSFIAAALCLYAAVTAFTSKEYAMGFFMAILVIINLILGVGSIIVGCTEGPQPLVVDNVVEYKVDSTIIINGADTSKVYTITCVK